MQLFLQFVISAVMAGIIAPVVIWLYKQNKWIDDPEKSSHPKVVHTTPVPRGGGVVVFAAVLVSCILFLPFDKHLIGILLGAFSLAFLGILDDVQDLNPYFRLFVLFIPAMFVVGAGIGIAYVSNPFGEGVLNLSQPQVAFDFLGKTRTIWILSDIFAFLWILWNMNIVNWSKGLDGQMPGFVSIAALVIGILSLRFSTDPSQYEVSALAFIVSGAFLGFLFWNMYPQKLMAGFGAGTLGGFFLAVLSILSGAKVATALLVLAIPTIDAVYVVMRRIIKGKSPVWGDRGHLHHRLMDLGWGKRRVAFFYWISTALLGVLALQLNSQQKFYTIIAAVLLFGGFVTWITLFFTSSSRLVQDNG